MWTNSETSDGTRSASACLADQKYSALIAGLNSRMILLCPKVLGPRRRTTFCGRWSKRTGLRTGVVLQLPSLVALESNAERDGTTTWTHTFAKRSGHKRKTVLFF